MRTTLFLALGVLMILGFGGSAFAQNKTVILVRHVEKDVSPTADKRDPEVSDLGRVRAERLAKLVGKYKPDALYSTDFKRTRESLTPLAAKRKKRVELYDPAKQQELVDRVMASKERTTVIVGHSNTTPFLANLFINKKVFGELPETEYEVIWILRFRNGLFQKAEIITY
jgi:broad specificity phosphatase PhoE